MRISLNPFLISRPFGAITRSKRVNGRSKTGKCHAGHFKGKKIRMNGKM